ncbi:MAG: WYL domain-containing protein, partial [Mycobacterium sp.]|uniref:helix-turn-helix transcriptional regulator n=1 Tax=Mycobacterium sp. TaxID=1785 RepID=UPI003C433338
PLLLDADEAVAMAVCLRLAAGGSVAGVAESAVRMLSKLDQVMPARLRSQVSAVHEATVTLSPEAESPVAPEVLMTLARACRDHEQVETDYTDRVGTNTQRRLEPYQLVTTGRRWYLLAYDRDRTDWRSLRLDRMTAVRARGSTFTPRPAPDAASYVRRAISASPYRYLARVRYSMPEEAVAQYFSPASASVEPDGDNACVVTAGGDDPERMVLYFAMTGAAFEVLEPPELIAAARAVSARLRRAASPLRR